MDKEQRKAFVDVFNYIVSEVRPNHMSPPKINCYGVDHSDRVFAVEQLEAVEVAQDNLEDVIVVAHGPTIGTESDLYPPTHTSIPLNECQVAELASDLAFLIEGVADSFRFHKDVYGKLDNNPERKKVADFFDSYFVAT